MSAASMTSVRKHSAETTSASVGDSGAMGALAKYIVDALTQKSAPDGITAGEFPPTQDCV
jgi:hypothetical protein